MKVRRAGGVFGEIHRALVGAAVDFGAFRREDHDRALISEARVTWQERVETEFRSIQVMNRFVTEVLGSGDPLDVWAGAADLVTDEIRHTGLCVGMVEALGGQPELPDPLVEPENPRFLKMPMAQRALATGLSMLAVNETISTAAIEDLAARCTDPVVSAVLAATLDDEETHHAFGWAYVEASLTRFDEGALPFARMVVEHALEPHRQLVAEGLAGVPSDERRLDAWPEPELAALGILGPTRQALVVDAAIRERLTPRLDRLGIA